LPRRGSPEAASRDSSKVFLALALVFVLAAIGKLARYLPWWGLSIVAIAQMTGFWLVARNAAEHLSRIAPRRAHVAILAIGAGLASLYFWGYPAVERFVAGHSGLGSDRDEALEVAVKAIIAEGRPYIGELSTGNPISAMPGELVLAAPFVWLGVGGLQTVFWLLLFYAVLCSRFGAPRAAAVLLLLTASSPFVFHEVLTSGDLLALSLYNAVACTWLLLPATAPGFQAKDLAGTLLLGLALSSRPIFVLLLPLLVAALAPKRGIRLALGLPLIALLLTSILSFSLISETALARSPFHFLLTVDDLAFGGAWVSIALLSTTAALVGARLIHRSGGAHFHAVAAFVLFVPVISTTVLVAKTLGADALEGFLWYGLWSLPFAAVALIDAIQAAPAKAMSPLRPEG
jgi:hypothetical protein